MIKKLILTLGFFLLVVIVFLNATTGRFAYEDDDGCTCTVSYRTAVSEPYCEQNREQQCDAMPDRFLLLFNSLDLNRP